MTTPQARSPADAHPLSEERPPSQEDFGVVATLERISLLWLFYIFSIGPMYWTWFEAKFLNGSYLIALFYEPLWQLAGLIPPLGHWLNWYVRWWNLP